MSNQMRPLNWDLQLLLRYETSSLICVAALLEQVGQGNMYVSRTLTPLLAALMMDVHTWVSTLPVDLYPRGTTNE